MNKVNHVDAVFGGKQVRFAIERADIEAFERLAGVPAFALLQKLANGTWSVGDLKIVLNFASMPDSRRHFLRKAAKIGLLSPALMVPPGLVTDVDKVLNTAAPAPFAVLAMKVLEAALFGLPEDQATFDEKAAEPEPDTEEAA